MKLFDLLINELDEWYVKQLKNEIYIFTEKIIVPYFNKNNYIDDFINNNTDKILKYLNIKTYLIELLSADFNNFLFELYKNYDNYFSYDNIFMIIIENVTNIIYDSYDKLENYESDEYTDAKYELKKAAFNFISKIVNQMNEFITEKNEIKNNENENDDNNIIENNENIEEKNEYLNLKHILNEAVDLFIVEHSTPIINFFTSFFYSN